MKGLYRDTIGAGVGGLGLAHDSGVQYKKKPCTLGRIPFMMLLDTMRMMLMAIRTRRMMMMMMMIAIIAERDDNVHDNQEDYADDLKVDKGIVRRP